MTKEELMHRAIELSKNSVKTGGGPFGAVIAKDGIIIAEASNSVTIDLDPTAHAEVNCIRQATRKLKTFNLEGCEIYTSCECKLKLYTKLRFAFFCFFSYSLIPQHYSLILFISA